jgi:hypothetical protein
MSENPNKKPDFLEIAKHQFAHVSAEFEKALESFKDSERRKQLITSYLDLLQSGLSKAQARVAKYEEKIAATAPAEEDASPQDSAAGADSAPDSPESESSLPEAPPS